MQVSDPRCQPQEGCGRKLGWGKKLTKYGKAHCADKNADCHETCALFSIVHSTVRKRNGKEKKAHTYKLDKVARTGKGRTDRLQNKEGGMDGR